MGKEGFYIRTDKLEDLYNIGKKVSLILSDVCPTTLRAAQAEKISEKVLLHCNSIIKLFDMAQEDYSELDIDLKAVDMYEINEAFASQSVAVTRDLGLDMEKVNIYGGGISIGHPIGATGAVLATKVMYELMRSDKKDALITMCIGGGQGIAMYFTKCQ